MSSLVFDDKGFRSSVSHTPLAEWSQLLSDAVLSLEHGLKHGHLEQWQQAVARLPKTPAPCPFTISDGAIHIHGQFDEADSASVRTALEDLRPWRKGPFQFDSLAIDSEWRSDWKWNRLAGHITPLEGRKVLDVGCGNGYYLWRMHNAGAACVLGIDPSLLYMMQFCAVQHFLQVQSVQYLPLSMETLPAQMHTFDSVFSMGVLYHRRDPVSHIRQLHEAVHKQGELILETLIIDGEDDNALAINERYANMRNVYELPTLTTLERWLHAGGFGQARVVSVDRTSCDEQRSTPWMTSHSLAEALDPANSQKTIEGHPRPLRAVVTAQSDSSLIPS